MSEAWCIAIATIVTTIILSFFGLGVKALLSIAKSLREFVSKKECDSAMGKQCKDISDLKKGFEENKSAIRQMALSFKQLHNVEIKYKG